MLYNYMRRFIFTVTTEEYHDTAPYSYDNSRKCDEKHG